MKTKALLISTDEDEGGLALLSINGNEVGAMNCLGYGHTAYPKIGSLFEPAFTCLFDEDPNVNWDSVFGGNPAQEKRLHSTGEWSYQALGQIVEIKDDFTALADCGGCLLPLPIPMYDPEFIGAYVGFDVRRLSVGSN
ncbi:hypothetical protein [Massilia sp. CCM 8734]|uniref:hypothetical protein n=1 Tax=Massilia sp. CCM 8734 TaxID=2609283 RepID=UPI0014211B8F|nr:hypothetical protein [Massilia sp. CCM 8734]NHZ96419.1 hypothetical protein [Massilia sp. CCM 8734]